jgi:CubicO group peptidase (beta-lactamase class C family)
MIRLLLVFALTLAGVQSHAASDSRASRADALLRTEMKERAIPGLQIAVVQHGQIVLHRSLGTANLQYDLPVTDRSVFQINSITKAFTGVAVMQLVEQSQIDLSAPVSTYLDDLPEAWRAVTVRQLLTHMAGIPNNLERGRSRFDEEEAMWAWVKTQPMNFTTGERFSYNQTNYALLRKIVERFGGADFELFIAERQFKVANMTQTGFGDSTDITRNKVQTYRHQRDGAVKNVVEEMPRYHHAASGINSTASDMARWIAALQRGAILKKSTLETLWTPGTFNDGKKGEWALGWITVERPVHRAVGATGGGRSAFYLYPEDDIAVVILTNLAGGYPEELIDEIAAIYIPGMRLSGTSALRAALRNQGYDKATKVAHELIAKDPSFVLSEIDLNGWAYRLLANRKFDRAVAIFKVAVDLYPDSGNAYDSLADAYQQSGNRALAIENYKRSLALDPKNTNATRHLKQLETASAN